MLVLGKYKSHKLKHVFFSNSQNKTKLCVNLRERNKVTLKKRDLCDDDTIRSSFWTIIYVIVWDMLCRIIYVRL